MRTVLISGAGIAGNTLAWWLARHGFRPTVVERAAGQRSSGAPVDVRGPALPVVEAMGLRDVLRSAATPVTGVRLVDAAGATVARVPMAATRAPHSTELEIPRADLAAILHQAAADQAEFRYGDSITGLAEDPAGVDVTFARGAPGRFDLVVGADGLHSAVRRLAFGPESAHVRHLGVWVATLPLGGPADDPYDVLLYNTPGRLASVHPARGCALAALIFRGPMVDCFDHRDLAQHKRLVLGAYQGDVGWRVPELLDRVRSADDLYFDSVSRVHLPRWSRGRIVLVGDAASCVSLFGDGSSLAIAGAHALAEALAAADHLSAFRSYEAGHRRRTEPKRRAARYSAALLVPRTRLGLATRNGLARVLAAVRR
ncbi:FAD-dependent monooxygenase [Micromonospora sp. DR5-3]|uniref:FAD-dependent monooxygenase n=1 Tax=unclassified Micromonospora TaxID=2617518 RepID=UPI00210637C7|nr:MULTISPECIES: FAD-dependent monooxygenase [unclassified Micromonospora]MCW3816116.1 FAD-dependent monooxygenase [Micromonospora sp. DR5-3]